MHSESDPPDESLGLRPGDSNPQRDPELREDIYAERQGEGHDAVSGKGQYPDDR